LLCLKLHIMRRVIKSSLNMLKVEPILRIENKKLERQSRSVQVSAVESSSFITLFIKFDYTHF